MLKFDYYLHTTVLVLFVTFLNCAFSQKEAFRDQLGGLTGCEDHCSHAISKLSKPNTISFVNSCSRGCRLFGIYKLMSSNLTATNNECRLACIESYQDEKSGSQASCIDGCNAALQHARTHHAKKKQFLFGGLDEIMNNLMQFAARRLSLMSPEHSSQTEIVEIFDGTNLEVIIIQGVQRQPDINVMSHDNKVVFDVNTSGSKAVLEKQIEYQSQSNGNRDDKINWSKANGYFARLKYKTENWWDSLTRKSGLAEFVLLLFWISTLLILAMTCCAQFCPHSKKKLSINGDLAFINSSKGDLPSYMQAYPCLEERKKSPYFIASVVQANEKTVPLVDDA